MAGLHHSGDSKKQILYTGRVEFEGTFIRAQHDAIISDILFRKCNE